MPVFEKRRTPMFGSVGKFVTDRKGAFAMQFALLAIPLTVCTGLAIDGGRAFLARYELGSALDAAALAIGSTLDQDADINAIAHKFVNANFHGEHNGPIALDVEDVGDEDETVILKGTVVIDTYFMPLVGQPTVTVSAESEVKRGGNDVEVALVLDITGSMSGSRIDDLQDAANDLVDTVVSTVQTPYYSKVALVPYSNGVNVGSIASSVRGDVVGPVNISGATWKNGSAVSSVSATWRTGSEFTVSSISKVSGRVQITVTGTPTALANGDTVGLYRPSSGYSNGNFSSYRDKAYKLANRSGTSTVTFDLQDTDGNYVSPPSGSTSGTSWRVQECLNSLCQMRLSNSGSNNLAGGDWVHLSGFGSPYSTLNYSSSGAPWEVASTPVAPTSSTAFLTVVGPEIGSPNYTTSNATGGTIQECFTQTCEVKVTTSATHGLVDNDYVRITGVTGMTDINTSGNNSWQVTSATSTAYILSGSQGPDYSNYSSGGASQCLKAGCEYYRFLNASSNSARVHQISSCVSERTGAQAYTDVAPSSAYVGRSYPPSSSNTCPTSEITPLTSNKTTLKDEIDNLPAAGSTAGQIGIAWGWYMLSPNFASLFPSANQPGAYEASHLAKVAVLMTDGEFNTPYCNGVIAADAGSGSGSSSDHINCNATNGNPYTQASNLCTGMKNAGIIVYTVGFDISSSTDVTNLLTGCATSAQHAYLAANGAELKEAFKDIANSIAQLRISK